MDASGKGQLRSQRAAARQSRGVRTANFKVPVRGEKAHDYLWRVHRRSAPRHNRVFNRSHYEGGLAERVSISRHAGLAAALPPDRRLRGMPVENGVVLVKFSSTSAPRASRAFRGAAREPEEKIGNFRTPISPPASTGMTTSTAYEDMLNATSHPDARWNLVPADRKWYRDYVITQTVLAALDGLK